MRRVALLLCAVLLLAAVSLAAASGLPSAPLRVTATALLTPSSGFGAVLPGRITPTALATATVDEATAEATSDVNVSDCTSIFPIEAIEAIEFGQTTAIQLRASFGETASVGGRATTMRFEEGDCALLVTLGVDEAQEAELQAYGTLGWLLDRYSAPGAAGIAQGNLTLPLAGSAVLFYPEAGLTALFDADLDALDRDTPVSSLFVREPYSLDRQVRRLDVELDDGWLPPLR